MSDIEKPKDCMLIHDMRTLARDLETVKRILNEVTLGAYVELAPRKVIDDENT